MKKSTTLLAAGILFCTIASAQETLQTVTDRNNRINGDNYNAIDMNRSGTSSFIGTKYSTNNQFNWYHGLRETGDYNYHFYNAATNQAQFVLKADGNNFFSGAVGIGTSSPAYRLHVAAANNDGILIGNYNDRLGWEGTGAQPGYHIRFAGYRDIVNNFVGARISALRTNACCSALATGMELAFYTSYSAVQPGEASLIEAMRIKDNGYIGIGTATPQSELAVKGTITTQKVKVTQTGWADYVFDSSYQLAPLAQVEQYIQQNKHLPEVPSAAVVNKEGIDVGDSQALLLKKIEELTLYIIAQEKRIKQLEEKVK